MTTTTLKPTIFGVGINDVPGSWRTKYYVMWSDMLRRCYEPRWQAKKPSYIGCTVDPNWHYLSNFKRWYEEQGDVKGKQLDKDIISPGNKVYGPDNCFIVSSQLNSFFVKRDALRGLYPVGVTRKLYKKQNQYRAEVRGIGHIGYYSTPDEAYQAFIQAKKELLFERFILSETDKRLKNALMYVYNHMEEYFV